MPDAIKPFCEIPPCGKIEFRVGGNMAVSKNRNIRDRVCIARYEWSLAELTVQNIERAVSKRLSGSNVSRELSEFAR